MDISRRVLIVTGTVVVVVALLLSLTIGLPAGLSFLAGSLIGVASLAAVVVRVRLMTGGTGDRRAARLWAAILTLPYYALVAVALWALARYFRDQAPWLLLGYLVILTAFAIEMARGRRPKATAPEADKA